MTWTPDSTRTHLIPTTRCWDPGQLTEVEVTYLRGPGEGRHDVRLGTRLLQVFPDERTTASHRSRVIIRALTQLAGTDPDEQLDPLLYLIGALTLAGATRLEVTDAR